MSWNVNTRNMLAVLASLNLGLSLGCAGSEPEAPPEAASAQLRLSVPPTSAVVPQCASPVVRLYRAGELLSCPVARSTALDGTDERVVIVCLEDKGLKAGVRYTLEAVYLQGSHVVARGPVATDGVVLSPGMNDLTIAPANLTKTLDANNNGLNDVQETCP